MQNIGDGTQVEIRRSTRRRRTVSARCEGNKVVVLMPSGLSQEAEQRLVHDLLGKLRRARARRGAPGDSELAQRAARLSAQYLDGQAKPTSVCWVAPMRSRWASCTPGSGAIRVSELLRDVPAYVLDYILVHELAHLVVPGGHTAEFWAAVGGYPRAERAIGYLEGYSAAAPGVGAAGREGSGEWVGCGPAERVNRAD